MKRKITFVMLFALMSVAGMAQKQPDWVLRKPTPENSTYLYQMEWGTGQTEREARKEAFARMFQFAALQVGQPINSEEINRAVQSGTDYSVISAQYNIPINKVCEYTETLSNGYRVYILCQVARAGNIHVQWTPFSCPNDNINKVYAKEALFADGGKVYRNGEIVEESELRTMFANSKSYYLYDKGLKQYHAPDKTPLWTYAMFGCIIGGSSQCCWFDYSEEDGFRHGICKYTLIIGSAVGAALLVVPPIAFAALKASGRSKIRKAVDLYNNGRMYSQNDINLKFGFTGNGICMALSF